MSNTGKLKREKDMKKVKIILCLMLRSILIVISIIWLVVYIMDVNKDKKKDSSANFYLSHAEKITGLDLDGGNIIKSIDTKGGFFGEGKALIEINYSPETFIDISKKVSVQKHWKELPMDEELSEHLLGFDFDLSEKGYYLFYDRNNEAKSHYEYKDLTKRHSFNFSVIILDEDKGTLIYMEKDT